MNKILQTTFSNAYIFVVILLLYFDNKFIKVYVECRQSDNNSILVQEIAWHRKSEELYYGPDVGR